MPQPTFDLLQELSESMDTASCLPLQPFIKLGTGDAPTLNYQLPQKSGFKAYGHFVPKIAPALFNPKFLSPPSINFYQQISQMDEDILEKRITEDLLSNKKNSTLLPTSFTKITKRYTQNSANENTAATTGSGGVASKGNIPNTTPSGEPVVCDLPIKEIIINIQNGLLPVRYYDSLLTF